MDRIAIENLLQQTDLASLVEQAGGHLTKNGDGWRGACPLHGGGNETAFSVYKGEDGLERWYCFADCDTGGDAIEFIRQWRGLGFKAAVEYLGGKDYQVDPQELIKLAEEREKKQAKQLVQQQEKYRRALEDLQSAERHLYYHEHAPEWVKGEWTRRGLNESWQGFYYLGGCDDFVVNDGYHTPTLTIPIMNETRQLLNIRHRLLKPPNPNDKYRPEKIGLHAEPFLAIPELGYDGDFVLVVEGEIKAAVTYSVIGGMDCQVIGVPGQVMYKNLVDKLCGKSVIVCPDPGAEKSALAFAHILGGRFFELPCKIDDWILEVDAKKDDLYQLIKHARLA